MLDKTIYKLSKYNKYDFFHIKSTTSTMLEVKDFLNTNNKNCIFLSDQQTAGKGRRGNLWHSPIGNIYCSISFDNFLEIKDHFLYSMLICVTIKMVLEKFNVKNIKFKWPNDIFYKNKKFGGIISETVSIKNLKSYMIVGFGININSSPETKDYHSTYVKSFINIQSINSFLLFFFELFFLNLKELKKNNNENLMNIFKNSLMFKDENIKIMLIDNSIISGKFKGINTDGSLQLENNNITEKIYNGSIIK